MGDKTGPSNIGAVVSVRGSVVDIRFDAHLPPIHSLLHAKEGKIAIEVLAQLDAHRVRGIALTPTQNLARGIAVEDTGGPLKAPVGRGILSRMFDVFGNAIDRQAAPTDVQWRTVHRAPPGMRVKLRKPNPSAESATQHSPGRRPRGGWSPWVRTKGKKALKGRSRFLQIVFD